MGIKLKSSGSPIGGIIVLLFYAMFAISWIVNLVQFVKCDFDAPYKEEVIHGIGICVPFSSLVTVWF